MRPSRLGYGSHSFLNEYIRKNKCKKIMEIGVADGENARTMARVAIRNSSPEEVEYYGFDLFEGNRMGRVRQKLKETGCKFKLFKGDSVKTLPGASKTLPKMDLIFIDGGHSFETVKSDWENSRPLIHDKTAVFFHNYDFTGVKRVVDNISREECEVEILHPSSDYATAFVRKKRMCKHNAKIVSLFLRAFLLALFSSLSSFLLGHWLLLRAFSHTQLDH